MLPEISLSILDIVCNSITAKASKIIIHITINESMDLLSFYLEDNGIGMTSEQLQQVVSPFYTTRATRSIGLGVPFLKQQAEITGGNFNITSEVSIGTTITCNYILSHIDRMPLGDIVSTIHTLLLSNEGIQFIFIYAVDERTFTLDTSELREITGDISFCHHEIATFIREYLSDNINDINQGRYY